MAKLYPPQINGTIPAFYYSEGAAKIVVPFTMNRAVAVGEVAGFALKIKTINGNLKGVVTNTSSVVLVASNASVTFFPKDIKFLVGQYYKIQLAYIDKSGVIGYYSTVGIIKCTTRPIVQIEGLSFGKTNAHRHAYTGTYSQLGGDVTEKMYSYQFLLYDTDNNIIENSGEKLHNTSFDNVPYESHEEFLFNRELDADKVYYIQFIVTTTNQLTISSIKYKITGRQYVPSNIAIGLIAGRDFNNGYAMVGMVSDVDPTITGTFLLSRASSKNNFRWEEIQRFDLHGVKPEDWKFKDYTVEQGVTYRYALQQYNAQGVYSNRIISNTFIMDFEDMFLYDGKRQLRIRYNPKVSTFKTDILENKVDTIGSQFPFITRNGNVYYKEFSLSGLISYITDEDENFITMAELGLDGFSDITQVYGKYSTTNLVDYNIAAERIFKNEVLDWLNNGQVKLFKSPAEGNFLVRLMNVSLTPMDQLSRMLHTFTATAYEVADFTAENLYYYGIIDSTEHLEVQTRLMTINIRKAVEDYLAETGLSLANAIGNKIKLNSEGVRSVDFVDLPPGTIISLDDEDIQIGATGAYQYSLKSDTDKAFATISYTIGEVNEGLFTYSYSIQAITTFGSVHEIELIDVPAEQFIGTSYLDKAQVWNSQAHLYEQSLNLLDAIQDTRTILVKMFFARFEKRPIQYLYIKDNIPTDEKEAFLNGEAENYMDYAYFTDMYCDERSDASDGLTSTLFDWDKADPFTLYRIRFEAHTEPYDNIRGYKYYVDANLDQFSELTDLCIDGYTKQPLIYSDDFFTVRVNDSIINLDEIEKYYVSGEAIRLEYVEPKAGVVSEISSSKQITVFNIETDHAKYPELYDLKLKYEIAFNNMITGRKNGHYSSTNVKVAYNNYLLKLNRTLDEYREENGLAV